MKALKKQYRHQLSVIVPLLTRDLSHLSHIINFTTYLEKEKINFELILVINGLKSLDLASINKLENKFKIKNIKILKFKENLIIGKARNIGATKATGKFLLFMDADVEVPSESISPLLQAIELMEKKANYAALLPQPLKLLGNKWSFLDNKEDRRSYLSRITKKKIKILFGPFSLIKANCFFQVGKWEDRVICAEDRDLAAKLLKAGYSILYYPQLKVLHKNPSNLKRIIQRKIFHAHANAIVYLKYPEIYNKKISDWIKMYISIFDRRYLIASTTYIFVLIFYTAVFYFLLFRLRLIRRILILFPQSRKLIEFWIGKNYVEAIL